MKNLWLSSSLLLLTTLACSTTKYKRWTETSTGESTFQSYFNGSQPAARYKAEVSIYGKHLSGILFFKFTNDSTCHVAFVTVPGAKLFDLQLTPRTDTVYECLPQLNRPGVLKTIKNDIRTFVMLDNYDGNMLRMEDKYFKGVIWRKTTPDHIYHYYQPSGEPITRVEQLTKNFKKKVELTATDFRGSLPAQVHILGKFSLSIHLTLL